MGILEVLLGMDCKYLVARMVGSLERLQWETDLGWENGRNRSIGDALSVMAFAAHEDKRKDDLKDEWSVLFHTMTLPYVHTLCSAPSASSDVSAASASRIRSFNKGLGPASSHREKDVCLGTL